jgi:hypothetical protein
MPIPSGRFFTTLILACSAFLAGCAGPSPHYSPSIDNVEALKRSGAAPAKVGAIGVTPGMPGANALSIRANSMVSSVGSHYGDYLAAALRQELELARLLNAQSATEITGTLLRNNIDAGGINTNAGQIEARFVVSSGGTVRYDKVKRIEHQWEGAFAGAVAIPNAANNYPVMVQKLVGSLVADPDFIRALGR